MKVSELIEHLKDFDQEADIVVNLPFPNRSFGGKLRPIQDVAVYYDQDTNQPHYVIELIKEK